jgi:hypothetical protein
MNDTCKFLHPLGNDSDTGTTACLAKGSHLKVTATMTIDQLPQAPGHSRVTRRRAINKKLFLFFKGDRDIGVGRKANSIALHLGDQAMRHVVMVPFVCSFSTILLGKLDAVPFNMVNGANMHTICTNYFSVFLDGRKFNHCVSFQGLAGFILALDHGFARAKST